MIVRIDGTSDARIADYRHVTDPHWLRSRGLFVAESRLVLRRLLAPESRFKPVSILATAAAADSMRDALASVDESCPVFLCDQSQLDAIGGYNFHRGCLALGARGADAPFPAAFAGERRLIALEGVGNPDNVGGIFRSAAALGGGGVLLDPRCVDPLYRKSIRTSMGAVFRVPFARVDAWPAGLDGLRHAGFTIIALTPGPDAEPIGRFARHVSAADRLVLVAGTEGAGLSAEARACADARVTIPVDPDVDSLNVTVAVAIGLYVLHR